MSIAAAAAAAKTGSTTSATTGQSALSSLSGNFQDFLGMLMTQLQNQDPTSPMDANTFTTELVQFSSVEQQINTNSSLTQLISLTQSGQMMQSAGMMGKTVQLTANEIPLQSGSGALSFTAPSAGTATITVSDNTGNILLANTVTTTAGSNSWSWNGQDAQGNKLSDGTYNVAVTGSGATALPFTVAGTVTGVVNNSGTLNLQLGTMTAPFSSVESVSK